MFVNFHCLLSSTSEINISNEIGLCHCGDLTLAACQVPIKATLSRPSSASQGRDNTAERLTGQDKDKEITHQAWSQAEQSQLGDSNLLQ